MEAVQLDSRLAADSILLGHFGSTALLLMRNAHYPWLVLVPRTLETEFHRLPTTEQAALMAQASRIACCLEQREALDKINIATIGNVVAQLHLHVIGRRRDDATWPAVVWGAEPFKCYAPEQVAAIAEQLLAALGDDYKPVAAAADRL